MRFTVTLRWVKIFLDMTLNIQTIKIFIKTKNIWKISSQWHYIKYWHNLPIECSQESLLLNACYLVAQRSADSGGSWKPPGCAEEGKARPGWSPPLSVLLPAFQVRSFGPHVLPQHSSKRNGPADYEFKSPEL